jgi:hypothetical protein
LYVLGTNAANYLSRQSGTTADDPAGHYGVFLRLYSPNRVETARFTVTPKDFAPTRFERDQSSVAILRNASGDLSEPQRRFRRGLLADCAARLAGKYFETAWFIFERSCAAYPLISLHLVPFS